MVGWGGFWGAFFFFGVWGFGAAEDGVGVEGVDGVEVPDLDVGVHGSYGDVVSAGGGGVGGGGADGDVEPFDAEGDGGEHDVVVDVEVVGGVFVDVDFEVADVVFGFGGDKEVIGGEDLELGALFVGVLLEGVSGVGGGGGGGVLRSW